MIGRLEPVKGPDLFVGAAVIVARRDPASEIPDRW